MEFTLVDSNHITYVFTISGTDITVNRDKLFMAMPINQVINDSEPWKFLKNDYIKMSKEAICCIEAVCKNMM